MCKETKGGPEINKPRRIKENGLGPCRWALASEEGGLGGAREGRVGGAPPPAGQKSTKSLAAECERFQLKIP